MESDRETELDSAATLLEAIRTLRGRILIQIQPDVRQGLRARHIVFLAERIEALSARDLLSALNALDRCQLTGADGGEVWALRRQCIKALDRAEEAVLSYMATLPAEYTRP